MSDIIQLLPDAIANQIAAGEVVQRPASAVKELLENAVDAGATEIQLSIKNGGKTFLKVIDNGCGMSVTDARMCLERHATSKIRNAEDLFSLTTMGFRGEAIASIAAVSQMELATWKGDDDLGTRIRVSASEVLSQEPEALTKGTTVMVKNLFFNIPARRNFLKSDAVETRHIVDEFQHIALAHPEIKVTMRQNDLETYNLPKEKLSQRIVHIFGNAYKEQLISCEEQTDQIRLHGYLGKPENSKKSRGEQFFFVNGRYIKSGYLNHAVLNAFEGLLRTDFYPFYVLFIDIDPLHVDVNVHPTKTEIKFDDERTIYGIVHAAVRQALGTHNVAPSIDFDQDINFGKPTMISRDTISRFDRAYSQFKSLEKDSNLKHWEQLYTPGTGKNFPENHVEGPGEAIHSSKLNHEDRSMVAIDGGGPIQIQGQYIIAAVASGLLVVDQQAAHEKVIYEKIVADRAAGASKTQQSLFPVTLELNPSDYSLLMEMKKELEVLGFDFASFGQKAIIINGMPAGLEKHNEKELFEGFIEQFKLNKNQLALSVQDNLARSLAQRSALRSGVALTKEEMSALVGSLFGCKQPNYTPDGRLTFFILDLKHIDNLFNR